MPQCVCWAMHKVFQAFQYTTLPTRNCGLSRFILNRSGPFHAETEDQGEQWHVNSPVGATQLKADCRTLEDECQTTDTDTHE